MFHAASSPIPSPRPPRPGRDAFFDNAKYLAIVLVAVAHSWEPLKGDSRTLQAAYMFVYAFHAGCSSSSPGSSPAASTAAPTG